jgi:glutamate synthase (NADPH/NADH) small chain
MGKPSGFLEYDRVDGPVVSEEKRIENFLEFHGLLSKEEQQKQAARCMDCGVPYCQAGMMISGMASGCPLNNMVPETNDLVYRGAFDKAYRRLSMTHSFPEFTSRVCPALCEAACTCGVDGAPVSTKENEKTIIEYAFENDLVKELVPETRTGKKVAVIGSGPSGLAAAQMLNRRGHSVTVYERNDRIGGLLRYGIPNMKLDKSVIDRRVKLMEDAGIRFITSVNVCGNDEQDKLSSGLIAENVKHISAKELEKEYDAIILACGASNPRDIKAPGREAEGIHFAVEFLGRVTKELLDSEFGILDDMKKAGKGKLGNIIDKVYGKDVIVIGGGDTGNDCVGTSIRLGAKSVTQLEMMPEPPTDRLPSNPWPEWPKVLKTDYGQEEAIYKFGQDPRIYQTTVKEFITEKTDKGERVKEAVIVSLESKRDEKTGRMSMVPVEGSERTIPAGLVLIAAGFLGSESYVTEGFGVNVNARTNVETLPGKYQTSKDKVFVVGDMHRGQSLVVWAISEGRNAALEVDSFLMK